MLKYYPGKKPLMRHPQVGEIVATNTDGNFLVLDNPEPTDREISGRKVWRMKVLHIPSNHIRVTSFSFLDSGNTPYYLIASSDEENP